MTTTGLSKDDISHIKQAIENQCKDYLARVNALSDGSAGPEDIETLIDLVSNDLARNGLELNDEPNTYGTILESIIDKLSEKRYEEHEDSDSNENRS